MIPIKDMPCEMKLIGDDIGKGQKIKLTLHGLKYISKVKNKAYITLQT